MVPTPHLDTYYTLTKALISIGRKNGFLLVDQLNDFLPNTASSPLDLETVMTLFARLGVGIGATEEEAQAAREAIEPEFVLVEGGGKAEGLLEKLPAPVRGVAWTASRPGGRGPLRRGGRR